MDYSCADEIVAKLLLRYGGRPPGGGVLRRAQLQEHHRDAIEAVLERHELLLVAQNGAGACSCWDRAIPSSAPAGARSCRGRAAHPELAGDRQLAEAAVAATVALVAGSGWRAAP
jgi:hypothetical protein